MSFHSRPELSWISRIVSLWRVHWFSLIRSRVQMQAGSTLLTWRGSLWRASTWKCYVRMGMELKWLNNEFSLLWKLLKLCFQQAVQFSLAQDSTQLFTFRLPKVVDGTKITNPYRSVFWSHFHWGTQHMIWHLKDGARHTAVHRLVERIVTSV